MKKFCLLAVSLLGSLALAESLLRLFFPQKLNTILDPVAMYDSDPRTIPEGTRRVPKPNIPLHDAQSEFEDVRYSVKTNNLGLIQEQDYHGQESRLGYVLGDSFAAGVLADIDKNYFAELQKRLSPYTLLNLSVTDHGTYEQYFRLKFIDSLLRSRYGQSASFAVLHIYLGNDVSDNVRFKSERLRMRKERITNWLAVHFHSYRLYRKFKFTSRGSGKGPYGVPVNSEFHDATAVLRKYLMNTDLTPTKEALDLLIRYCRLHRMAFYVVLIPTPEMASAQLRQKYSALYGQDAQFDYVKDFLQGYFDERGIMTISLTDYFLRLRNSRALYHTYDSHWTVDGQRLAAGYVAEQLGSIIKGSRRRLGRLRRSWRVCRRV